MSEDEHHNKVSRVGHAAHGVYYLLLAVLVGLLALGDHSEDASAQGALAAVARQPLGRVVLVPIAVGFAAYSFQHAREAWAGDGWERLAEVARSVVWLGLTGLTVRTVFSGGGGGGGESEASITRTVLDWPAGPLLVAAVGLVVIGIGAYQGWKALSEDLDDELEQLGMGERRAARWLGTAGYAGRALAYALVGGFVMVAAATRDADSSRGLDGALQQVLARPGGRAVAIAVAIGFAAFGLFRLVESRYRFDD